MDNRTKAIIVIAVDDAVIRRIWPPMLNGIATAPAMSWTTITASSRMPNTRQKSFFTNRNDRSMAANTSRRSSTMSGGAKVSIVHK